MPDSVPAGTLGLKSETAFTQLIVNLVTDSEHMLISEGQ
jgi:hypothetical protein